MACNKIHKSYKYRIYPTKNQEKLLLEHFGCCRFVYNHFLSERKEICEKYKKFLSYYDNAKALTELKKEKKWLSKVIAQSLQATLANLDKAYKSFFKNKNGYPKFKKKSDNKDSFSISQDIVLDEQNYLLFLPKFKIQESKENKRKGIKYKKESGIKTVIHRKPVGKLLFATISKTSTGKYFISLTYEQEKSANTKPVDKNNVVGIDTGIKNFLTLSNGETVQNIKSFRKKSNKIKYNQRQLSKKKKGSKSREKQRHKLAVIHEKVKNSRKDYIHKVSTNIIKNHDIIFIETLNVKNMIEKNDNKKKCNKRLLSQSLTDVSLGMFYSFLEYKASWNNKILIKIDQYYPSSKTCSSCGHVNHDLTLNDREWTCTLCNVVHDRDLNAAKNILEQGLRMQSGLGTKSDLKQKQGEAFALAKSMNLETDDFHEYENLHLFDDQ